MTGVAAETLIWARETAALDAAEAAARLGFKDTSKRTAIERLQAYESGEVQPSESVLKNMAKVYRRSLLSLYLERPPAKSDRGEDFRTLHDVEQHTQDGLVDAVIRDIKVRQSILKEAIEEDGDGQPLRFIGSMTTNDSTRKTALSIIEELDFDLSEFRRKSTPADAFRYLRRCAEAAGIFVLMVDNLGSHHSAVPLESFRGFALADPVAPFVAVNVHDAQSAWSFTLLHELAHLWIGETGVSGAPNENAVERYCNAVAADILLHDTSLDQLDIERSMSNDQLRSAVSDFADLYNVSGTMVAYALYRNSKISFQQFSEIRKQFLEFFKAHKAKEKEKAKNKPGGPPYQIIKSHRLGSGLITMVDRMLYSGILTTTKSAKVLGVKPRTVETVLSTVRSAPA